LQHVFNPKKLAPKTLINIIPRESIFIADKLYLKKGLFLLLREGIICEEYWAGWCYARTKLPELINIMMKSKSYMLILGFLVLISVQTYGQVNICSNEQSNHPIDKRIIEIRDSLQKIGIDTILIYSHWLYTGSFNGYGKAIWKYQGICYQLKIPFHNGDEFYGLGQQDFRILGNDSIIDFFFMNRIDTITVIPTYQSINIRHDAIHFVEISYKSQEFCFVLRGLPIQDNPNNILSKWFFLLADENLAPIRFIDGIEVQRKNKGKRKKNRE